MSNAYFSPPTAELAWRAAKIALLVGTVLNLINQGDALWGDASWSIAHVLMNYMVPFGVSSFSAMQARAKASSQAPRTAHAHPEPSASYRASQSTD